MSDRCILQEAFLAGFKCSGEGGNGEYPYGDKGATDDEIWNDIQDDYKKYIADSFSTNS